MAVICRWVLHLFIFYQISYFSEGNDFNVIVDELSVGKPKNYILESTVTYLIQIRNLSNIVERIPPRIFVKCEECSQNTPLLIVVTLNKGVISWELPVVIEVDNYQSVYKITERTLCPYDILNVTSSVSKTDMNEDQDIHPVIIYLSTPDTEKVTVELVVNLEENFLIDLNSNKSVQVTPSTPAFYLYEFERDNVTSVLLHVTSEDDICLIVSVQNVSCPLFDLEENVGFRGHFETVTRQGGLTLTKESFPNGFYVVLIVSSDDKFCNSMLLKSSVERKKTVVLSVSKTISLEEYKLAVGVTVSVIIVLCCGIYIIFFFLIKRDSVPDFENEILMNDNVEASASAFHVLSHNETSPPTPVTSVIPVPNTPGDTLSIKTDSSLDETDFDLVNDAELDKNIFRMKGPLFLCDLARKKQTVFKKKSELYFWNLLTVGIFYLLPVFQLVFTDQYRLNQSGREDICYYNFLCSHPLWWFSDFNHMFSNIGYISFGALFMLLTLLKERDYRVKICTKKLYKCYGIPQHFGLFYTMGAALVFEGVLSLCYHVCPNHYNFQFDTSFMYVICTICMIKIYQTRHPDISASAYATFSLLAGVIFLGMYGVFSSSLTFRILFTIVHLSTCIYLSLQIYYMGRFKLKFISVVRLFKELQLCRRCHLRFFLPMFPSRFALLAATNACNWGLAVGSFVYDIKNFSSYLLTIFMANLVLYTAFYILMKFICKEKFPLQSIVYILLAMLIWSAALYFFFSKTISWRLTPAESKLYNQKCNLLEFYDNHDIWHFISAAAMFFSFMVLLTLDDDLRHVHRSKIVVF